MIDITEIETQINGDPPTNLIIFHYIPADVNDERTHFKKMKVIKAHYNKLADDKFEYHIIEENGAFHSPERKACINGKGHVCKDDEVITKSIVDLVEKKTNKIDSKKLNSTVILILDEDFVLSANTIQEIRSSSRLHLNRRQRDLAENTESES